MAWYGLNRKRIVVLPHLITICNSLNSHENFCAWYYMQHIYYIVSFERSDFYKICQQRKQVKTMDLKEVWPDTFDKGYIYIDDIDNPNMNPFTKFSSNSRSTQIKDILLGKISDVIPRIVPIDEKVIKIWSLQTHAVVELLT